MARAAVIGEATRTAGFALAGAVVLVAEDQDEARAAWRSLPADIAVLVLTPSSAAWLGEDPTTPPSSPSPFTRHDLLVVVMPP
jgi:vacuolar-type H+-ATPase subunit F/Vma7